LTIFERGVEGVGKGSLTASTLIPQSIAGLLRPMPRGSKPIRS